MNAKKLTLAILLQLACIAAAEAATPFYFRGVYPNGTPITNTVTITPWPSTNYIVGVGTNLVVYYAQTYTPDTNGVITNSLMAGNYRLTISGLTYGMSFGITDTTNEQNLAQLSGVPVVTFMNFTLSQFSDAGYAAYSNSTMFAKSTDPVNSTNTLWGWVLVGGYSTTGQVSTASNIVYVMSTRTNHSHNITDNTNYGSAAFSNSTAFVSNSSAGVIAALQFTPPTNTYVMPYNTVTLAGYTTNFGMLWIATNLASGTAPNASAPNGSILTGTNGTLYIRTNSTWVLK